MGDAPLVSAHERGLVAVRGEVPLGEHLGDALLRVDVVRDLGEVLELGVVEVGRCSARARVQGERVHWVSRGTDRALPLLLSLSLSLPFDPVLLLPPPPPPNMLLHCCFCLLLFALLEEGLEEEEAPFVELESARWRVQPLSMCGLMTSNGTGRLHTGHSTRPAPR